MRIPVLGMDPSFNNWGMAEGLLDLTTGILETPILTVLRPKRLTSKQIRQNSKDLYEVRQLAEGVIPAAMRAKAIFVEVPVGSQNARSMASYGICVGILGTLIAHGIQLIEVTASEVKAALTTNERASKDDMILEARKLYPEAIFPSYRGEATKIAEHVADAIGAIHAGVRTPVFQNLLRLYM